MSLVDHAKKELELIGYSVSDSEGDINKWMYDSVIELIEVFANQGHSGASAMYCIDLFRKLVMREPLGPLTGNDDEWVEVGDGIYQNSRCSSVFKQADRYDGKPYDIDGKVFVDKDGCSYTSVDSHVMVEFPYTPKTEYIEVDE